MHLHERHQAQIHTKRVKSLPPTPGRYDARMCLLYALIGNARLITPVLVRFWIIFSESAYLGPETDLHQAACDWLASNGFTNVGPSGLLGSRRSILEESARLPSSNRIRQLQCDIFIDDLPELLLHDNFPGDVRGHLFRPARQAASKRSVETSRELEHPCRAVCCLELGQDDRWFKRRKNVTSCRRAGHVLLLREAGLDDALVVRAARRWEEQPGVSRPREQHSWPCGKVVLPSSRRSARPAKRGILTFVSSRRQCRIDTVAQPARS